ncbi:hypothetical protein N8079_03365 [Crocinitomicaceae bacterium]|nr:hypothetical protein [Crocinitomicaceae bacterium]
MVESSRQNLLTELKDAKEKNILALGFNGIADMTNSIDLKGIIDKEEAKEISNDTYIIESYLIMKDILNLFSKND